MRFPFFFVGSLGIFYKDSCVLCSQILILILNTFISFSCLIALGNSLRMNLKYLLSDLSSASVYSFILKCGRHFIEDFSG